MKALERHPRHGNMLTGALTAGALVALASVLSVFLRPETSIDADIRLTPSKITAVVDEPTTLTITVTAAIPVNVFAGELRFDPTILTVDQIDYNTSVADLWAEEPWFSNGDGTINFAGGTTRPGGFTGTDQLLTITFRPRVAGENTITLTDARILQHDGLGTDVALAPPIDTLIVVTADVEQKTIITKRSEQSKTVVLPTAPTPDINGDGRQSLVDISVFMIDLTTGNVRSDLNQDGWVNTKDLSILLNAS